MARFVDIVCAWCGNVSPRRAADAQRAQRIGAPVYCNRACAGLKRRNGKSVEEKRAEKRAYDGQYRERNRQILKAKKAAHYKRTADREKERQIRQKNMPRHVEYCRKPEYRAKKHQYDIQRCSAKYGEFAECHRLLVELQREIVARVPSYYERHRETIIERTRRWKRWPKTRRDRRLMQLN